MANQNIPYGVFSYTPDNISLSGHELIDNTFIRKLFPVWNTSGWYNAYNEITRLANKNGLIYIHYIFTNECHYMHSNSSNMSYVGVAVFKPSCCELDFKKIEELI